MKTYGEVQVHLPHSWPRHWMEASVQIHAPVAFIQVKSLLDQLNRRLGGPQNRSGRRGEEKILTLQGLELRPFGCSARSQSLYRQCYPGLYKMGYRYVCNFQSHYFCYLLFTEENEEFRKCYPPIRHSKCKSPILLKKNERSKPSRSVTWLTRRRLL
jgi:hypothetical protein